MRTLSKSKLIAYRQCAKRLWLEVHRPDLRADSSATEASFAVGNQIGEIARQIYDPESKGKVIDPLTGGFDEAFSLTQELLNLSRPIFEAGFKAEGALAFADVLLPVRRGGQRAWRMIEVKSSASVKDYHHDDVAIQAWVARASGLNLTSISLAYIDSTWIYPGGGDYRGLLVEEDLTSAALPRGAEVQEWTAAARKVVEKRTEPVIETGKHCSSPHTCGFFEYCESKEPHAEYPIEWLPRSGAGRLGKFIEKRRVPDMRDVDDSVLTEQQKRVKQATISGRKFFDRKAAKECLSAYKLPAYFMDFETIQFPVPIWKGTRPYQQIPFQFSVHRLSRTGKLEHEAFLDISGEDPSNAFAQALIAACGERGPIFVYHASFENSRLRELATRFPRLATSLNAIVDRVVDLLPVVRDHYYHPSQKGRWSIKSVLPAMCPDLNYSDLDGVQDGGMAMQAFLEVIDPQTNQLRKEEIEQQLFKYCELDTYAMMRIWSVLISNT
jgi:hypothetical protein